MDAKEFKRALPQIVWTGETEPYKDLVANRKADANRVELQPYGFTWLWKKYE